MYSSGGAHFLCLCETTLAVDCGVLCDIIIFAYHLSISTDSVCVLCCAVTANSTLQLRDRRKRKGVPLPTNSQQLSCAIRKRQTCLYMYIEEIAAQNTEQVLILL